MDFHLLNNVYLCSLGLSVILTAVGGLCIPRAPWDWIVVLCLPGFVDGLET